MKLNTTQLLRATLKNGDLIQSIPVEVLNGLEQQFINEVKSQIDLQVQPTLQSVTRSLLEQTKPEHTSQIMELATLIQKADVIDSSTQQLQLYAARRHAARKLMQILLTIEEPGTKEEREINLRLDQLKLDITTQFSKPTNAKDWSLLQKQDEKEVYLDIEWLKTNRVPIKSKVLYGIITMTNGGKTILKTWLAFELLKQGQNILFLAQEEPKEDCIRRIHQQALRLSEDEYRDLTRDGFEFVGQKFTEMSDERGWGNIFVAEWAGIKIDLLKQYASDLEAEAGLKIDGIVIDYAKLVNTNTKTNQEWERVGKVFEELKVLAMQTDRWIITSMQLNREASEKMIQKGTTPDLYDVAGAYEATHHINYAWVARLRYSEFDEPNPDANTIKGYFDLTVQKEKYGNLHKGHTMRFNWTGDHTLVEAPMPTPNDVELPYV